MVLSGWQLSKVYMLRHRLMINLVSLVLHGEQSPGLSNILLKECKKEIDTSIAEIGALPASNSNKASLPNTSHADTMDIPPAAPLLAAELEGIKLDMVIMQRNIQSNTHEANIISGCFSSY